MPRGGFIRTLRGVAQKASLGVPHPSSLPLWTPSSVNALAPLMGGEAVGWGPPLDKDPSPCPMMLFFSLGLQETGQCPPHHHAPASVLLPLFKELRWAHFCLTFFMPLSAKVISLHSSQAQSPNANPINLPCKHSGGERISAELDHPGMLAGGGVSSGSPCKQPLYGSGKGPPPRVGGSQLHS